MDLDVDTLRLCLATIFAIAMVGALPGVVRVLRMRRAERLLGWRIGRSCTRWMVKGAATGSRDAMTDVIPLHPGTTHTATQIDEGASRWRFGAAQDIERRFRRRDRHRSESGPLSNERGTVDAPHALARYGEAGGTGCATSRLRKSVRTCARPHVQSAEPAARDTNAGGPVNLIAEGMAPSM
jgi:hypothetical protein